MDDSDQDIYADWGDEGSDRGDDSDYYGEEEKVDYMGAERKAYERVSTGRHDLSLAKLFPDGFQSKEARRLENINRKLFQLGLTPEEKFKIMISIFFNTHNSTLKLGNDDLDILSRVDNVKNAGYRNPIAWIFGYYVVVDKRIKKDKLEKVKGLLKDIEEVGLEDVIRYARYWMKNKD